MQASFKWQERIMASAHLLDEPGVAGLWCRKRPDASDLEPNLKCEFVSKDKGVDQGEAGGGVQRQGGCGAEGGRGRAGADRRAPVRLGWHARRLRAL